MSRRAPRALLVLLGSVLSACTLAVDVNVEVADDGSGAVEVVLALDAAAVARIGGDLEAVLALDDLRADGWSVEGPARTADGTTTVRLRQGFADAAEADDVFAELQGAGGPFRDLEVRRERSLLETRWGFAGTVDLGAAVATPGRGPRPTVDGAPLAEDLAELEAQLGESIERLLRLRVGVRLPGDVESNATTRADNGAVWQIGFGDGPVELDATGREARTGVIALLVAAGLVLLVGLVALLVHLAGRTTARVDGPRRPLSGTGRAGP